MSLYLVKVRCIFWSVDWFLEKVCRILFVISRFNWVYMSTVNFHFWNEPIWCRYATMFVSLEIFFVFVFMKSV